VPSASIADPPAADDQASTDLPPLFRRHIRRPRLTRQLDASKARILMLTAPAGYGKTTLAAEWLQARSPQDVAWYQATPMSADVAALSVGISDAAAHILPSGERLRQRLSVPEPPKAPGKTYAELLAADFANWPKSAWLVIDDYHQIASSPACEQFVETLLALCPLRLLVTTRGRPSWASARRVVYGEIVELDESSLRMTEEECVALLRASDIKPTDSFLRAADGWPALISIASLLDGVPPHESEPMRSALLEFLQVEVLKGISRETLAFLGTLAHLPTADDAVLAHCFPGTDVEAHLAELIDTGLVATRQGSRRLHPLFRDLLRRQNVIAPEHLQVVHRALDYYEGAAQWEDALSLAMDNRLEDRALDVVGAAAPALLRDGRLETLEAWLSALGRWAFVDHRLVLARAEILLRQGRPLEARLLAEETLQLAEDAQVTSRAWRILGQASHLLSEYARGLECYERSAKLATSTEEEKAATWGLVICAAPLQSVSIHAYFSRFETLVSDDPDDLLRVAAGRVAIADTEGSLSGLWEHLVTRLPLLDMGSDPVAVSALNRSLCYVSLSRGDFATSHELANRLISYCRAVGLTFPVAYVLAYRAMAEVGLRRFSEARRSLRELERAATPLGDPHLRFDIERIKVRLALATGGAAEWIEGGASPFRPMPPIDAWADYAAICALAHASAGDPNVALALSKEARSACTYPSVSGPCLLATAIAESRLAPEAQIAASQIAKAILECARIESLEPVVVAYRAYPSLIKTARNNPKAAEILRPLLALSHDRKLGISAGLYADEGLFEGSVKTLLTRREQEVMHLLAQGRSTREIASTLFIARSTAKVHVNHILRKLNASSRLQAVLRWQQSDDEPTG
jgi:ATP/maltotriose-dependent transcriptional regulator MalT